MEQVYYNTETTVEVLDLPTAVVPQSTGTRQGLMFQNQSEVEVIVSFTKAGAENGDGMKLPAGTLLFFENIVPQNEIYMQTTEIGDPASVYIMTKQS